MTAIDPVQRPRAAEVAAEAAAWLAEHGTLSETVAAPHSSLNDGAEAAGVETVEMPLAAPLGAAPALGETRASRRLHAHRSDSARARRGGGRAGAWIGGTASVVALALAGVVAAFGQPVGVADDSPQILTEQTPPARLPADDPTQEDGAGPVVEPVTSVENEGDGVDVQDPPPSSVTDADDATDVGGEIGGGVGDDDSGVVDESGAVNADGRANGDDPRSDDDEGPGNGAGNGNGLGNGGGAGNGNAGGSGNRNGGGNGDSAGGR